MASSVRWHVILPVFVLTLALSSGLARAQGGCTQTSYVPAGCTRLAPGEKLPTRVTQCYCIDQAGDRPYIENFINVLDGGAIYFVEDPNKTIDFQVSSLLIEKGGLVQAGSQDLPFGRNGGKLTIGLYGNDPTEQGTRQPAGAGIQCLTNADANDRRFRCFPKVEGRDYTRPLYCTVANSDDPCSDTDYAGPEPLNHRLEGYGNLNYDTNPFGFKTLAVSYGGTLNLFGFKGAKPLQDPNFRQQSDSDQHCVVPKVEQSTLDSAEMKAWASLSGSSWARLERMQNAGDLTVLTLDRPLPDWEVGDDIVVGSTDWYPNHSELRTIRACTSTPPANSVCVDMLKFPHYDKIFDTKTLESQNGASFTAKVNRSAVDLRASVGLLSRSIKVYSLGDNPKPNADAPGFPETKDCMAATPKADCYFGGHMIARQGFRAVRIQGVEFKQLGQGGRMGHYPVHFHLAKATSYTGDAAFVKDSSVWDSMTRFITIHGTHEVTLARNVGFLSLGHGYYIEDASEIRNLLCHNLGVSARAALQQYVTAQSQPEHWCGGSPPPSARYVPPILDGVAESDTTAPARQQLGSDSYMPTMFWMMNAYNEFVGNAAVGVHGFGSCFWLLGSAVSGPSKSLLFDGLAGYNTTQYQAPLLRFRGNTCMSAALALPTQAEIDPSVPYDQAQSSTGFTAIPNPYLNNGAPRREYLRPVVNGNFRPIPPGAGGTNCTATNPSVMELERNTKTCVTTIIDRFATSYNWAQVNFSSVWLRPWFYLFANGAVTDQLFAGLTFVTGGDWSQAVPGFLGLAQNGLYVGTSQFGGSPYAARSGPIFEVTAQSDLTNYAPCRSVNTCNVDAAGTGYWKSQFNPKRLISIYDGPHMADGNTFLNVGAWECDPQPCKNKRPGECVLPALPCGVYSSTVQPESPTNPGKMIIPDAAIGWKQPNGFFYPPAFTYRRSSFLKTLPQGLPPPPPGESPLDQCFSPGPGDYVNPSYRPGSCRHEVIDRNVNYIQGNVVGLNAATPTMFKAADNNLQVTTIDFSTIIADLDASLTGASGVVEGLSALQPTTSVSRNRFFDLPSQTPECQSFGVQTSPYAFVTSVVARLEKSPRASDNVISLADWPGTPMVALYRQWKLHEDEAGTCTQVCSETDSSKYGCPRATFMGMSNIHQSSYLTMTEPPGLPASQPGAPYYIDTNSGRQSILCVRARTGFMEPAPFVKNDSYLLYNIFPRPESRTRYQLYVGKNAKTLDDIEGRFVRVLLREGAGVASPVKEPCDPREASQWCTGMKAEIKDSILTVTLDHAALASDFAIANQPKYQQCMPRDLCYFDGTSCKRCTPGNPACIDRGFLPADIDSMNRPDAGRENPLDTVCTTWSNMLTGKTKVGAADVSFADCPAGKCLGFAFKLPNDFAPVPYKDIEAQNKLSHCFLESAWMSDALQERMESGSPADPLCGAPRAQSASDFCTDPQLALVASQDSHISENDPDENHGDSQLLSVDGGGGAGSTMGGFARTLAVDEGGAERALVGFDGNAIDSFVAGRELTGATLMLTTAAVDGPTTASDLLEAHPLVGGFVEGGDEPPPVAGIASADGNVASDVGRSLRAIRPRGARRLAQRIRQGPPTPGVTWNCAIDANTDNEIVEDCIAEWDVDGGDQGELTAPAVAIGPAGGVIIFEVTEDVLAGVTSWLIHKRDENDPTGCDFHSREGAEALGDLELAPTLILR